MSSKEPSRACFWLSLTLIACIYLSAIWTIIQIKQFISTVNLNEDFFRSRQPILTTTYVISFLFVLYILNPITLIFSNLAFIDSKIPLIVNDIANIIILSVYFPRAWILSLDRAFNENVKNWIWRREINAHDSNFVIHHRKHLSSPHILVYSIYLLFIFPIFIILHILPYVNIIPLHCHIVRIGLLLILLISTTIIIYNISAVSDEWNVRSELLLSVQTTGIAYTFSHIFYIIIAEIWLDQHWALFIQLLFICAGNLCVIYYTCCWTRKKYLFIQKVKLMHHLKTNTGRRSSFISFLNIKVQFQDIMDHKDGIQAFCNHLVNEFGLESMLFLLEVTQFKAIVRRLSNDTIEDNVPVLCDWHNTQVSKHEMGLKQKLHINKHVFSAASILNIHWLPIDSRMFSLTTYQIALYLYDKYIEESSDLCINISFGIRKEIYRYFKELLNQQNNAPDAIVKIYNIYDNAFTEIWRLIQTDSFHRFKATPEFRRLISVLVPEEATKANKDLIKMIDEELTKERDKGKKLKKQRKSIRKKLSGVNIKTGKNQSPVIIDILQHNFPDIVADQSNGDNVPVSFNRVLSPSCSSVNFESVLSGSVVTTTMSSMVNSEETLNILNGNVTNETKSTTTNPSQVMTAEGTKEEFLKLPKLHYKQHSLPFLKRNSHVENELPQLKFSHSL